MAHAVLHHFVQAGKGIGKSGFADYQRGCAKPGRGGNNPNLPDGIPSINNVRLISPVQRVFPPYIKLKPKTEALLTLSSDRPEDIRLHIAFLDALTENAVCSFKTTLTEDQFHSLWGNSRRWDDKTQEFGINELGAKFSLLYWGAVRDVAKQSPTACKSIFHLPMSIILKLHHSSTMELNEFCFSDFKMHGLRLTCEEKDLSDIYHALTCNQPPAIRKLQLSFAKFKKTMRCISDGLPTDEITKFAKELI